MNNTSANLFYYPINTNNGYTNDDYTNPNHLSNLFNNKITASIPPMKNFVEFSDDNNINSRNPFHSPQQQGGGGGGGNNNNTRGEGEDISDNIANNNNNNNPPPSGSENNNFIQKSYNYVDIEIMKNIEKALRDLLNSMELPPVPHFISPNTDDNNINFEINKLIPSYFSTTTKTKEKGDGK